MWDEDLFVGAGKVQDVYFNSVGPDYFKTMRIPLYDGRDFAWTDTTATGLKIILNQAAVKLFFPDRNPLGQFVSEQEGKTTVQYQVVGVVGDAKYEDLRTPRRRGLICR